MKRRNKTLKNQSFSRALRFFCLTVLCSGGPLLIHAKVADEAANAQAIDGHSWEDIEDLVDDSDSATNNVGDYKFSMQDENHGKWLMCDGQAVSRTEYTDLFNLIGIQFGEGDQIDTFNLPDARSRLVGVSSHPSILASDEARPTEITDGTNFTTDLSPRVIGDPTGTETISVTNNIKAGVNSTTTTYAIPDTAADSNMPPSLFIGNLFIYSGVETSSTTEALDSLTE